MCRILSIGIVMVAVVGLLGCVRSGHDRRGNVVVFKHGKIEGDPQAFVRLLQKFHAANPDITVIDETLPSSTDEQHQFYIINLEGRSADFDVLALDVIWLPEFARAGWLRDLSPLMTADERQKFFPTAIHASMLDGKVYAVPWYLDAGLLFYRKDLLAMYGFRPPQTWPELVRTAQYITKRHTDMYGFIWQGKQNESLVCNALEFIWSNGGDILRDGRPVLDQPANVEALSFMRDLIVTYQVTPPLVTTANEETTRQVFSNGNAVFLRNWPYVLDFLGRDPFFRKKIGVAPLPGFPGHGGAATLGGWLLAVNHNSRNPAAAEKLITFLTSETSQRELALGVGYKPSRMSLYHEQALLQAQPFIAELHDIFLSARPRPVTPYYMMITQVVQPEFSGAISGIRSPEVALRSAQKQVEHIMEVGR